MRIALTGSARFERLFQAWRTVLSESHTVVDLRRQEIKEADALLLLNLHAYIGKGSLKAIEEAKRLGISLYALSSWGVGFGIGRSYTREQQLRAAEDGCWGARSPIRTCSPLFGYPYDLLPKSPHRRRWLRLLEAAQWPPPTGKTWRCWLCSKPAADVRRVPEFNSDQRVMPMISLATCEVHSGGLDS